MNNRQKLTQQQLEAKDKHFFFQQVNEKLESLHKEEGKIISTFLEINHRAELNNFALSWDEFELLGMFSFLLGVDYTGQAYPQKNIVANAQKRFEETEITEDEFQMYLDTIQNIQRLSKDNQDYISNLLKPACENIKNQLTENLSNFIKASDKLMFNQLRAKLNSLLNDSIIPISFAVGLCEIKNSDLTPERLLKANSLLNEQATFSGKTGLKLTGIYGNQLFNELMKKSSDIFNSNKFAIIYEESIITAIETSTRFEIFINPEKYTLDEYNQFKTDYLEKFQKDKKESEEKEYVRKGYKESDVKDMMQNHPDMFIDNIMEDLLRKEIETPEDIANASIELKNNVDYMQHIYQYMAQNMKSEKRGNSKHEAKANEIHDVLLSRYKEVAEKYKKLVEYNCAEIDSTIKTRVIDLVNDCCEVCQLNSADEKQYIISQLLENGVKTYQHLSQILTIIETCSITGKDAQKYVDLYEYTQRNSIIVDVFNNVKPINDCEVDMSLLKIFKDWYSFYIPENNVQEKSE